jgi:hypothetical protein
MGYALVAVVGFLAYPILFYLGPKLFGMLKKTGEKW